jgi:hypothetical protein
MAVPYTFGSATSAIPLSQLDSNFATTITLGNTAIQLGNTVTTLNNMTLANVTISSGNVTITNVSVTTANVTTLNAATVIATTGNITTVNATTVVATTANATTANITTGNLTDLNLTNNPTFSGGTANGVLYLNASKVATSGSALTWDGTTLTATNASAGNYYSSAAAFRLGYAASYPYIDLYGSAGNIIAFGIAASEQMRLTSTGLGIGTSSPAGPLDVRAANAGGGGGIRLTSTTGTNGVNIKLNNSAGNFYFGIDTSAGGTFGNANAAVLWYDAAQPMVFATNNTKQMTLDSSGNLGLGVTPSAWTYFKPLQAVRSAFAGSSGQTAVGYNWYYDGAYKYYANDYALKYAQNAVTGQHTWDIAASGTAGNAISFTQAMTLDASGRQLVGYTSSVGTAYQPNIQVKGSSASNYGGYGVVSSNNEMLGFMGVWSNGENSLWISADPDNLRASSSIVFSTDGTERARITASGYFKASDAGTYVNATGSYHELYQTTNSGAVIITAANASQTADVASIYAARNTTNNTFYALNYYNTGAAAYKFRVADSGDVTNTNGTYGTISDAKMKTDIVDAGSQWSDIKALRFRKFKMKDDPSGLVQLGVVAQEVEQTSPGLVDEHADRDQEGNDLGTTTKSVKTSVLLMKAAVALQEAMARIEKLEAKVAALEGK